MAASVCGAGWCQWDIRAINYISQEEKCPCYEDRTLQLLGREVALLLGPDITLIRKGSVLAMRAGPYIH